MKQINSLSILALCLLSLIIGCTSTAEIAELPSIYEPFPNLAPEIKVFKIDATKGDTLVLESGTKINIPAHAFSDSLGEIKTGEVEIHYRELHNTLSVFLSGAPMHYDSLADKGSLETAGMFEIRAQQQQQELQLSTDKEITVSLASFQEGEDFNFYSLNENDNKWQYEGTNNSEPNPQRIAYADTVQQLTPEHPFPFTKDYFVYNIQGALDIYFNDSYVAINKYSSNKKFLKTLQSYYGFDDLDVNGSETLKIWGKHYYASEILWKKIQSKKIPKWVHNQSYMSAIKSLGNQRYRATFTESDWDSKNPKTFSYTAQAIMPLRKVMRKKPDAWQAQYDAAMAAATAAQKRMEASGKLLRTFNVSQLGWCNWDRFQKMNETTPIQADCKWPGQNEDTGLVPTYYFVQNKTSYVRFTVDGTTEIKMTNDPTAFFMAVISPDSVAIFSQEQHNALNWEAMKKNSTTPIELNFTIVPIQGRESLEKLFQPDAPKELTSR